MHSSFIKSLINARFMPKLLGHVHVEANPVEIQELQPEAWNAVAGAPQVKNDPD